MYKQISANKTRSAVLIGLFLVFVIGIGWLFAQIYDNSAILYVVVAVSMVQAWASYYFADRIALMVSGAKELKRNDAKDLFRVAENLAIAAGIPMPRLYLIDDTAPNAFATGRDPAHASLAVTRGLLEKLDKPELEGVMAHEISHVTNYDIRLSTLVVVLVGVVALASDWFLRMMWWGSGRRRSNSEGGGNAILLIIGLILALLAPLAATMIQLAISRKREFLADASGALLTRYPEGLARALEKIAADREPLEVANKATAHLYFENPLKNYAGAVNGLFSTHPPAAERIRILRTMI